MEDLRKVINDAKFISEATAIAQLSKTQLYTQDTARSIEQQAIKLVEAARSSKSKKPLLDTFLLEYGLSNDEGVALMCLAESLLRVPDWNTADLLIADKLGHAEWHLHAGKAESMLVNASTWALMLTGRLVELDDELVQEPASWFKRLIARVSEPVVQSALRTAMEILGQEFVLGETIEKAIARSQPDAAYSFDMLGEAARDANTAERYFQSYLHAINVIGETGTNASVSIKLSALHPRYEATQKERVMTELVPKVATLCDIAKTQNIQITIDAEEADRLDLSLDVIQALIAEQGFKNLGVVVQAYSKRAPSVLDWLIELANQHSTVIEVRLVKGAYWDAEIKHAQVEAYPAFPVYTRKENTDFAYLVCAKKILEHPGQLFGQFATHNAHTIAAITSLANTSSEIAGNRFEFQRLHGMGTILFDTAETVLGKLPQVRTYAPVGSHQDLLAYLVRRLLENGANSSFVNRFLDEKVPPQDLVSDPAALVRKHTSKAHPAIKSADVLFIDRENSMGLDFTDNSVSSEFESKVSKHRSTLEQSNTMTRLNQSNVTICSPINRDIVLGHVKQTSPQELDCQISLAAAAQFGWNHTDPSERAEILRQCSQQLQSHQSELMILLVNEAGKTLTDACNEVREAIDFCRFYATQLETNLAQSIALPGPTGESNTLKWQGRGVWVCISPWNFPLAIFLGQISAALAAGNSVIAKPSELTPLIAQKCIALLHAAGVPEHVCQLVIGDGALGQQLVEHTKISGVAFTGGTSTARRINIAMANARRAIVPLIAETGGQNAMIVDSTALLEQVTDDVIDSAFRSAGQRCSALRVLFLQEEISEKAIEMIIGSMDELTLGDPGLITTDIGPVISKDAAEQLNHHINDMHARGWVIHQTSLRSKTNRPKPNQDVLDLGHFVPPTLIEIPSIETLTKEHFGPILHIVRFKASEVELVVDTINNTGFGLTCGIHTRIEARANYVAQRINAGNIYVNRNMTGAVVGSQPFGGQGNSGTGPKAGGPNYLQRFAVEKVVTINTVANGGNAELLSM